MEDDDSAHELDEPGGMRARPQPKESLRHRKLRRIRLTTTHSDLGAVIV